MKNQTWTIIKKEFARFFGDRSLVFTAVLMPGLLIYVIYSFMGNGMAKMEQGSGEPTVTYVENMPQSMAPLFDSLPIVRVDEGFDRAEVISRLANKDVNEMLVSFPEDFDHCLFARDSGALAPNIRIYYNSVNKTVNTTYMMITTVLNGYESSYANMFDINREDDTIEQFNQASDSDELGQILGTLFPLLIVMLIFSGCMAVAPSAIAGEKERGTIATLLVTPMKRSQLALGKIVSLSVFALLSGISSFLGIILSLPKLLQAEGEGMNFADVVSYTMTDYALLLCLILATTLIMVSLVSVVSAWAKDVKSAGTMITPFMLLVMFCGLLPMLQGDVELGLGYYLIPFYNSIQCMVSVFAFDIEMLPMVVTICSNIAYTALAVWVLTRLFNSEKVMFGK